MTDESLERVLPQNLEAERAVLGAILIRNAAYEEVAHVLRPDYFFRRAHQTIYEVIAETLSRPDSAIDTVVLKDALGRRGRLEDVGGPRYLGSLTDGVPSSLNIDHYAEIVREMALYRALIYATNKTLVDCYDADKPASLCLSDTERRLLDLSEGYLGGRLTTLRQGQAELMEDLEYRVKHRGELTGVETGFPSINELTSGWQAGDMNIIAARPSIGKTTFAVNTAVHGALAGKHVVYFSMEMTRKQLEFRVLSMLSKVPLTRIVGGFVLEHEWTALSQAMSVMGELPFSIDDTPGLTPTYIRSTIRRAKVAGGCDLAVVDYVQLMAGEVNRRNTTKREVIADAALKLKNLAKDEATSLMVLSQLSRKGQDRSDPRPQLSDLRDAGELEEYADAVCFLHRKHHRESGVTNFILEKQRNGPTGTVNLTLDRDITLFVDGGEEKPPTPEDEAAEQEQKKERTRRAHRRRAHVP